MAHQVNWLPAALDDLESISESIAGDSPGYAAAVVDRVFTEARKLREFPQMGRRVPEWHDDHIRELVIYSYRLIYQIQTSSILVLAVIHGARILPEDLRDRNK